jgi:hypothetical protein
LAFFGDADQAVGFEGAKMVVELLARNMEASGEHGGGGRFGKLGEDASTDGVEGHSGGGGVVDDFDREHGEIRALTIFIVKRFVPRKYGTGSTLASGSVALTLAQAGMPMPRKGLEEDAAEDDVGHAEIDDEAGDID